VFSFVVLLLYFYMFTIFNNNNIVCENDCLEVVELVNAGRDNNTLHVYATYILHIIDDLHKAVSLALH
jgi:hypothetical protein